MHTPFTKIDRPCLSEPSDPRDISPFAGGAETAKTANETATSRGVGYSSAPGKLPAIMFYPGDWKQDPSVQVCGLAARGLWMELLFLMHRAPRRGFLEIVAGQSVTLPQLARLVGFPESEVAPLLQELEAAGVFSRDENGVIYSRRMDRDECARDHIRRVRSEAGKKGAVHGHKGGRPRKDEEGGKRQKRQTKRQITPSSSSVAFAVSTSEKTSDASASGAIGHKPDDATERPTPTATSGKSKKPREPNPLFDAVAAVTGLDPATAGSHIGSVTAALTSANPPYTADEVHTFGRRFHEFCSWARGERDKPHPGELQKYIGKLRAAPALAPTPRPSPQRPTFDY